jgi:ketosteroid isomerase-like protein
MNRREAIIAGITTVAAAVAVPTAARAQDSTGENPELEPIRALLDAYDEAFTNHDLDGIMACLSEKAAIMGTGPGEIWSGPDEIKEAHQRFFEGFDYGEQKFEYEFSIGDVKSDIGWMVTSGNVTGKKDGEAFSFPVNVSLTAAKDGGKWLITTMHFSTLTDQTQES